MTDKPEYVLARKEPTEGMRKAGSQSLRHNRSLKHSYTRDASKSYKAMTKNAPELVEDAKAALKNIKDRFFNEQNVKTITKLLEHYAGGAE
jgi:hypothetical protein